MNLRHQFYKFGRGLKNGSPIFLSALAIGGVIFTSVLAVKATPRAKQRIGIAEMNKGEPLTEAERVIAAAPAYLPAILSGTGTIICILGANGLNKRQQACLLGAYTTIDNYHKRYRNTLIDLHGKEIDEEVRAAMAREYCDYHQIGLDTPDGKVTFYEEISGQTFVRYEREVMDAEYHLNRNFVLRGTATLNEFYDFLGLPQTDYGEVMGWTMSDGYYWIDFEHKLIPGDGGPDMYLISMIFGPHEDYLDY